MGTERIEVDPAPDDAPVLASVTALASTPVKGLQIRARQSVRLERDGVRENRAFFLVDDRGRMVNGKHVAGLSAVRADYEPETGRLVIDFPSADGATVAGTVELGEAVRTRFFSAEAPARVVRGPWSDALSEHFGRSLRLVAPIDGFLAVDRGREGAVSLVSRGSLDRLARVAGEAVDPRRFRMLIEVQGPGPHGEDGWLGERLLIGEAEVVFHGHVGRCLVTGQNPESGLADLPTLDLLRTYRQHLDTTEPLACGIYGEVFRPGVVRVGDAVRRVGDRPEACA
jgi:uncharacterized protein YcbX